MNVIDELWDSIEELRDSVNSFKVRVDELFQAQAEIDREIKYLSEVVNKVFGIPSSVRRNPNENEDYNVEL